jgi:hypothetical protein
MPKWLTKIDVTDAWQARQTDDITIQQLAGQFASELRRIRWPGDLDSHREDLLVEFDGMSKDEELTTDEFDGWLEELYNMGDTPVGKDPSSIWTPRLCWISTF